MTIDIRADLGLVLAVFLGLLLFGVGYNALVAHLERKHYLEGFTSLAVAAGCFITLLGLSILSWQAALLVLLCFIASGLPMITGSIIRYIQIRSREIEAIKRGEYDDEIKTMAE